VNSKIRKKNFAFAITILVMCCSLAPYSYGWGKTWMGYQLEQSVKEAGLKLGPLRIRTMLYLTNAGYDSNVYRTPSNPIKDYSITAGPGFYIYLPLKKKIIFLIYESPQYVYFAETKRERTWNNYFNGQMNFVFNRFLLTFGKGYSVAREIWNTEIDIRPQRKEDSYQGSVFWQKSKKVSLFFRYRQAKYDYEDLSYEKFNIRDRLNRIENYINFTGYYRLSFRIRFFLDFEYGFFNFENPSSLRDSKSYAIFSGLEFSPLGIIRGRINLGYKYFDALNTGSKDYKGIVGDTTVSVRLVKPLSIRASYKRDVEFSIWYDNPYFLENRIGGGASLYLFKNIRLDYDYYQGRNSYPETRETRNEKSQIKRKDNYFIQSIGIYFRLKKNIGIGVTANQWVRDSNLDWEDGRRRFVGVNLTYEF